MVVLARASLEGSSIHARFAVALGIRRESALLCKERERQAGTRYVLFCCFFSIGSRACMQAADSSGDERDWPEKEQHPQALAQKKARLNLENDLHDDADDDQDEFFSRQGVDLLNLLNISHAKRRGASGPDSKGKEELIGENEDYLDEGSSSSEFRAESDESDEDEEDEEDDGDFEEEVHDEGARPTISNRKKLLLPASRARGFAHDDEVLDDDAGTRGKLHFKLDPSQLPDGLRLCQIKLEPQDIQVLMLGSGIVPLNLLDAQKGRNARAPKAHHMDSLPLDDDDRRDEQGYGYPSDLDDYGDE